MGTIFKKSVAVGVPAMTSVRRGGPDLVRLADPSGDGNLKVYRPLAPYTLTDKTAPSQPVYTNAVHTDAAHVQQFGASQRRAGSPDFPTSPLLPIGRRVAPAPFQIANTWTRFRKARLLLQRRPHARRHRPSCRIRRTGQERNRRDRWSLAPSARRPSCSSGQRKTLDRQIQLLSCHSIDSREKRRGNRRRNAHTSTYCQAQ